MKCEVGRGIFGYICDKDAVTSIHATELGFTMTMAKVGLCQEHYDMIKAGKEIPKPRIDKIVFKHDDGDHVYDV